jgi:TonB family protein
VGRSTSDQLAKGVVEEPKRSILPYFAVAIVAAVAIWTFQQQSIQDSAPEVTHSQASGQRGAHPATGDLRTLFSADDYPVEAQRNGEEGTVQAELAIDRRGRVSGCRIVRSSGHASLDGATCRILQSRARFIAARDLNGDAAPDRIVTPLVVWRLEG